MRHPFVLLIVGALAALLFIPFLGGTPLFDWDEINFAECAREMLVTGDYSHVQLHYKPFWEKPPFFIWMQAVSMNIFGVNEFAARFPNAVCSIVTLVSLCYIGTRMHSQRMGILWALLYASTLLPHLYFRSGLIDPWFNLFIFLASWQCIKIINEPEAKSSLYRALTGGIFLGLAVLTKGPAALIIAAGALLIYCLWSRNTQLFSSRPIIVFAITTVIVACSWFLIEWLRGNGKIIEEFIAYQVRLFNTGDAGHDGPFVYHFVVLLLGCFPVSVLFILYYLRWRTLTPFQKLTRKMMLALFWTVLILFSIVKTKIVHYSSFCYFPLTFLAALNMAQGIRITFNRYGKILFWSVASIIFLATLALTLFPFFQDTVVNSGLIDDPFAVMNLQANVPWSGWEWLLPMLFLAGVFILYHALRKDNLKRICTALVINFVFIWLSITLIIPKVELYTQHAAVAFYMASAGRDCDIETHGFKSYGYVFYSKRTPEDYHTPEKQEYIEKLLDKLETEGFTRSSGYTLAHMHYLEHGPISRPAYLVVKTPREHELMNLSNMHKLYDMNGYSFFVRLPDK